MPELWTLPGDMPNEFLIGVELGSLFDVDAGATCACGLSFSSPLPFGSTVDEAFVAVTDRTTHAMTLVDGFVFSPNVATDTALDRNTGTDWFGLATTATTAITQPTVGPNEVLKLWYRVTVVPETGEEGEFDPSTVFTPGNLEFAAGSAQSDGTPNFGGVHPLVFFSAIPEPSSLLLAIFAGLGMTWRKRR